MKLPSVDEWKTAEQTKQEAEAVCHIVANMEQYQDSEIPEMWGGVAVNERMVREIEEQLAKRSVALKKETAKSLRKRVD